MKTLKEYIDFLKSKGYVIDEENVPYQFIDNELQMVTFVHETTRKAVHIGCYYPDSLVEYLKAKYPNVGDEYCFMGYDIVTRIMVKSAVIETNIVNVPNFFNGEKPGIILSEEGDGGVMDFSYYYPHRLDLFEKCLWVQNNETEHAMNIMLRHIENIRFFNENIKPILEGLGYYNTYDSMLDLLEKENSDQFFVWKLPNTYEAHDITFTTDCITGEFRAFVPFGTYDEKAIDFKDLANNFNRDEFVEAINLSKARATKMSKVLTSEIDFYK